MPHAQRYAKLKRSQGTTRRGCRDQLNFSVVSLRGVDFCRSRYDHKHQYLKCNSRRPAEWYCRRFSRPADLSQWYCSAIAISDGLGVTICTCKPFQEKQQRNQGLLLARSKALSMTRTRKPDFQRLRYHHIYPLRRPESRDSRSRPDPELLTRSLDRASIDSFEVLDNERFTEFVVLGREVGA